MSAGWERLAVDGDRDAWRQLDNGKWKCLTNSGVCDDDADLERAFPPVTFYRPESAS